MTLVVSYLKEYSPLTPGLVPETISTEWLVHEARLASKLMLKSHLKVDILRFVHLCRCLESEGYRVLWIKHQGCLGISRTTKEVTPACKSQKQLEH